jgi:hypothetical protein
MFKAERKNVKAHTKQNIEAAETVDPLEELNLIDNTRENIVDTVANRTGSVDDDKSETTSKTYATEKRELKRCYNRVC